MAEDKYISRHTGQQIDDAVDAVANKADLINFGSNVKRLPISQMPMLGLWKPEASASCDSNNKLWYCTDGKLYYRKDGSINADGKDYDMGTPAYVLYYNGDTIYKWGGSENGFVPIANSGGGQSVVIPAYIDQMLGLIKTILSNAVFTSDQSSNFAALDALEDAVDSITLDTQSFTFNGLSGTKTIVATTIPAGKSVTWSSSNTSVASVSNGVVTPLAYGSCTITATAGDKSATCSIVVQKVQVSSITISNASLNITTLGGTQQLTANTNVQGVNVEGWRSSNTNVARVDNNGLVTSVGWGSCTITAYYDNGNGNEVTASCNVSVAEIVPNVTSIAISPSSLSFNAPNSTQLTATTSPESDNVTWSSSNTNVATISASGLVTSVGYGTCVITATATNGTTQTCNVSVNYHKVSATINNVAVTSGGNPISNGDSVLHGSQLSLVFTPNLGFEISSLAVSMGGVDISNGITDGSNGTKELVISNVTGDISIVAQTSVVEVDLMDDAEILNRYVIHTDGTLAKDKYGNTDALRQQYNVALMRVSAGTRYLVSGYNWKSSGGTAAQFNAALLKKSGNDYVPLTTEDLIDGVDATLYNNCSNIVIGSSCSVVKSPYNAQFGGDIFDFVVPDAGDIKQETGDIYFGLTVSTSACDVQSTTKVTPFEIGEVLAGALPTRKYSLVYENSPSFKFSKYTNTNYDLQGIVIKLKAGTTYSFSGYSGMNVQADGVGLLIGQDNRMRNLTWGDVSGWTDNSYFNVSNPTNSSGYVLRTSGSSAAGATGTFTTPPASVIPTGANIYVAFVIVFNTTKVNMENFTFNEVTQ